jgi:hypothetical protein
MSASPIPQTLYFDRFGVPVLPFPAPVPTRANKFDHCKKFHTPGSDWLRNYLEQRAAGLIPPLETAPVRTETDAEEITRIVREVRQGRQTVLSIKPAASKVCLHEAFNTGTHSTHLLDSTDGLVEARATSVKELSGFLVSQGFREERVHRTYTAGQPVKEPKVTGWALDAAHSKYLEKAIELEEYQDLVEKFLEPNDARGEVWEFLYTISDTLADGSFCPIEGVSFSRFLKKAFVAYRDDHATVRIEEQVIEKLADDDSSDEDALPSTPPPKPV